MMMVRAVEVENLNWTGTCRLSQVGKVDGSGRGDDGGGGDGGVGGNGGDGDADDGGQGGRRGGKS